MGNGRLARGVLPLVFLALTGCGGDDAESGGAGGSTSPGGAGGTAMGGTGAASSAGTGGGNALTFGTCFDEPPPGAQEAPDPPAYGGGSCPSFSPGLNNVIHSAGIDREFMLVVPEGAEDGPMPLVFLWHWLSGNGEQFAGILNAQQTANETGAILVFPTGIGTIPATWAWSQADVGQRQAEDLALFDDILGCVSERYSVNKNCVSSVGVSDGALWTSQLAGLRGQYLSSILVLSGGVGPDPNNLLMPWQSSPHKMPALALWGGTTDVFAVVEFDATMRNLEAGLDADGHFVVECIHNCGHGVPPLEPVEGQSLYTPLFAFVLEHPYWLPDGASPFIEEGLPLGIPPWCAIGVGNAVPRTGECSGTTPL